MTQESKAYAATFKAEDLIIHKSKVLKSIPPFKDIVFGRTATDHMFVVNWNKETGWEKPMIKEYSDFQFQPSISAFHYSTEVFEGQKAFKSENKTILFRPLDHIKRLNISAARMCLPTFDANEMFKCLVELVKLEKRWVPDDPEGSLYIRPFLIGTEESVNVNPPDKATLAIIIFLVGGYLTQGTLKPISLFCDTHTSRSWHGGCGNVKTGGNYGPTLFTQMKAKEKGYSQVLWAHDGTYVTEVGTMNFFMVIKDKDDKKILITSPLEDLILDGITRRSILTMVKDWPDVTIKVEKLNISDIIQYNKEGRLLEAFGSGTAAVICAVNKIMFDETLVEWKFDDSRSSLTQRIYDELRKIQRKPVNSEWTYIVE